MFNLMGLSTIPDPVKERKLRIGRIIKRVGNIAVSGHETILALKFFGGVVGFFPCPTAYQRAWPINHAAGFHRWSCGWC